MLDSPRGEDALYPPRAIPLFGGGVNGRKPPRFSTGD
jgi:hypothetical protein